MAGEATAAVNKGFKGLKFAFKAATVVAFAGATLAAIGDPTAATGAAKAGWAKTMGALSTTAPGIA